MLVTGQRTHDLNELPLEPRLMLLSMAYRAAVVQGGLVSS
jgi:hypothetical protein